MRIVVDFSKSDYSKQVPVFEYKDIPIENYIQDLYSALTSGTKSEQALDDLIENICLTTFKINDLGHKQRVQHNLFERLRYLGYLAYTHSISGQDYCKFLQPLYVPIIRKVTEWERKNKPAETFHKGTAFFWVAEYYLCNRNVDAAFNHFSGAINEDFKNNCTTFRDQGGYKAASLIGDGHHATPFLIPIITKLKELHSDYRSTYNRCFTYKKFVQRFLLNPDPAIERLKFYFTRTFSHLCDFSLNYESYLFDDSPLISSTLIHYLFGLSVLFEELLKLKWSNSFTNLFGYIVDVCKPNNFNWSEQYNLDEVNGAYKNVPWENDPNLVQELLDLSFRSVSTIRGRFTKEARLLVANRIIRNLGGHTIVRSSLLASRYHEFLTIICHGLFLILDKL